MVSSTEDTANTIDQVKFYATNVILSSHLHIRLELQDLCSFAISDKVP